MNLIGIEKKKNMIALFPNTVNLSMDVVYLLDTAQRTACPTGTGSSWTGVPAG